MAGGQLGQLPESSRHLAWVLQRPAPPLLECPTLLPPECPAPLPKRREPEHPVPKKGELQRPAPKRGEPKTAITVVTVARVATARVPSAVATASCTRLEEPAFLLLECPVLLPGVLLSALPLPAPSPLESAALPPSVKEP
ncbi:UNVERIFIED_CONTAM: hypothetical protein FKN15_072647 [Acipenser sinensis]